MAAKKDLVAPDRIARWYGIEVKCEHTDAGTYMVLNSLTESVLSEWGSVSALFLSIEG